MPPWCSRLLAPGQLLRRRTLLAEAEERVGRKRSSGQAGRRPTARALQRRGRRGGRASARRRERSRGAGCGSLGGCGCRWRGHYWGDRLQRRAAGQYVGRKEEVLRFGGIANDDVPGLYLGVWGRKGAIPEGIIGAAAGCKQQAQAVAERAGLEGEGGRVQVAAT